MAIVRAWAESRGVTPRALIQSGGLAQVFGRGSRRELTRMLQRRLAFRALRNTSALVPLMAGAVAGAELNRRATRALGEKVVGDLSSRGE
jgi:carboxylesterase type B